MSLFVGSFLGVGLAFVVERLYDWYEDRDNRKKLKVNIKSELESSLSLLGGRGITLPTIMWNSAISTGDVKLLSFDERTKVSSIYFEIETYNLEAKRADNFAMITNIRHPDNMLSEKTELQKYWLILEKNLDTIKKSLRQNISNLLKESLWS